MAELGGLRRFCYSLTGSAADADDLLQATVEKLLLKGMPEDAHTAKWSYRVCKNVEIRCSKIMIMSVMIVPLVMIMRMVMVMRGRHQQPGTCSINDQPHSCHDQRLVEGYGDWIDKTVNTLKYHQ